MRKTAIAVLSALLLVGSSGAVANAQEVQALSVQEVQEIATREANDPEPITGTASVSADGIVQTSANLDVSVDTAAADESTVVTAFERGEDLQLVSIADDPSELEVSYTFEGKDLLDAGNGIVIVNSQETGETEYMIEPAWAVDANGDSVETSYSVDGSQLTQHINGNGAAYPIVADPYLRYIYNDSGRRTGQELVFNRNQTSYIANGSAGACILLGRSIPGAIACAPVVIVAGHANSTGNCVALRSWGPGWGGTPPIPVSTRC